MTERPRFFDDLAGVAGGAFSALSGLRDEAESTIRARVDEAIRKFDLVKREDLEAVQEMAAMARAGQEAAELRLTALEAKVATLMGAGADLAAKEPDHAPVPDVGMGVVAGGAEFPLGAMPGSHTSEATPIPPPPID